MKIQQFTVIVAECPRVLPWDECNIEKWVAGGRHLYRKEPPVRPRGTLANAPSLWDGVLYLLTLMIKKIYGTVPHQKTKGAIDKK